MQYHCACFSAVLLIVGTVCPCVQAQVPQTSAPPVIVPISAQSTNLKAPEQPVPPAQNRLSGQPSHPAGSGGDSKAPMVPDTVVPDPGFPASVLIPENVHAALNGSWSDGLRF